MSKLKESPKLKSKSIKLKLFVFNIASLSKKVPAPYEFPRKRQISDYLYLKVGISNPKSVFLQKPDSRPYQNTVN